MYEILRGGSCYTPSEESKLLTRINQKHYTQIRQISGHWLFYINLSPDGAVDKIKSLVQAVDRASASSVRNPSRLDIYITPRNISPWSSRATNIAHDCGLKNELYRLERGRCLAIELEKPYSGDLPFRDEIYDRMTEVLTYGPPDLGQMFNDGIRKPLEVVDIFSNEEASAPLATLKAYNQQMGLGLDQTNMEYLVAEYKNLGRPPTDVELFMWAQVNSEHCRHHVFNAAWTIDGLPMENTLFDMIKKTHKVTPDFTLSAYSDNAAVLSGEIGNYWAPDYSSGVWTLHKEEVQPLIKVETHNHPTAISPFPGASTGSGGEIRDEGSVGRGSQPKASLVGFFVSDLLIPSEKGRRPWEKEIGKPSHYASSLDIMMEGPIGSARFNNEFGRPNLAGTFRTLLTNTAQPDQPPEWRGYHKPIMIAGGIGTVRPQHAIKESTRVFNGAHPIAFIHDVGAGGLSNGIPELVKDAGFGGDFELRQVKCADSSMSPLEIWCNEAQERYVLLVNEPALGRFANICRRERCGFSDVGKVIAKDEHDVARLILTDREPTIEPPIPPIDLPMEVLFPPGRTVNRSVERVKKSLRPFDASASLKQIYGISELSDLISQATQLVFSLPAVGSKVKFMALLPPNFTSVGGLTVRDQLVGPWQTPVADVAVTLTSFSLDKKSRGGEAMAMGEKPNIALISAAASARMAVVESLMNLAAADIKGSGDLKRVKLSANWMAAVNHPGEGAELYDAVHAIGMELCPALGLSIPVGKDSTSMKARFSDRDTREPISVTAPISVVISAFSLVGDVRSTWTPQLRRREEVGETVLLFVDLAHGHKAMGGSALAQCLEQIGNEAPDVRDTQLIKDYFEALQVLHQRNVVLAYHDRSDGGLLTTVAEMAFAGRVGADISVDPIADDESDVLDALFNEELGAVIQVRKGAELEFAKAFSTCGPPRGLIKTIGFVPKTSNQNLVIRYQDKKIIEMGRGEAQQWWSRTSLEMAQHRDNPTCAESEYRALLDDNDPGISYKLQFDPADVRLPLLTSVKKLLARPRVAILREQGVNGHKEMAFAFHAAGFEAIDVHMSDILGGFSLEKFHGLAACGGFSYGDVLGAGQGWAQSILRNDIARKSFETFLRRPDTFTLGVCNGCQMLARLKGLIPGAQDWPTFAPNSSTQFESRFSQVVIQADSPSSSVFFAGMSGSSLPIVVSHGEGRADFSSPADLHSLNTHHLIPMRYTDHHGSVTEEYPFNPNGSPEGIAAVQSRDGRVLAVMPHPERTIMADVGSWAPKEKLEEWGQFGPWFMLFLNARRWVG
ncbi:MAG: hypothetical protein Q9193_001162 [Seirophora villosa]